MNKSSLNALILLFLSLISNHLSSQEKENPNTKKTDLEYKGETIQKSKQNKSVENDSGKDSQINDGTIDINFGLGGSSVGITTNIGLSLDIYHFLFAIRSYHQYSGQETIGERSILLGYRYRTYYYMASAAIGYGNASFECSSGLNMNCYNFKTESIKVIPFCLDFTLIAARGFGIGINANAVMSKRKTTTGFMVVVRFGLLR